MPINWGITLVEWRLAAPADRIGHRVQSAADIKSMQEVITFAVFVAVSHFRLRETISPNQLVGFALIVCGAALVFFKPW